jgi:multisubunit Na+/H+ antiporter MnhC subunit
MTEYLLCFVLFSIGLFCAVRRRNIIKIIIGIGIMEYAVNLFLILIGYRQEGRAPISASDQVITNMVDPVPQAMVLVLIVLGLTLTLFLVTTAIRIYEKYGTFDITKINRLRG